MSTQPMSRQDARDYVSRSSKGLQMMFRDFNLNDFDATMLSRNIWGDLPPESLIWGYNSEIQSLGPENFHTEVLEKMAKSLNNVASKKGDQVVQKAITTTSASAFIPIFIDPTLVDIVKRETPYLSMVPKKTMAGKTVNVPRRTSGVTPTFNADDASSLSILDQTYGDINVTVKYLYAAGQVSGPAIKTSEQTLNLKQANIQHTFLDLQKYRESIMMRGVISNGTETWTGLRQTVANGYDGVFKRVHEDASGNETELNGGSAIGLGDVDDGIETILTNGGKPDYGIMDFNTGKNFMQTARTYQRLGSNEIDLGHAIGRLSIDQTPFFATNQLLTTANNKSFFISDQRAAELRVLMPDTYVDVAQDLTDTERYFWKAYETMVVSAPEWIATVNGGV